MNANAIRIERPTTNSKLFAHTRWDALPAAAGLFHLAYFLGLFFLYPRAPLWVITIRLSGQPLFSVSTSRPTWPSDR